MHINEDAPGNISQQQSARIAGSETGHDPKHDEDAVPLPPDDEAPLEEDMSDVDAADSVASEHPDN